MAGESRLQTRIRKNLEKDGWKVIKIMLCSEPGFPDQLLLKSRRIAAFIEAKAKGKDADPLQKYRHKELRKMGFQVFVIDTWEKYLEIKKSL